MQRPVFAMVARSLARGLRILALGAALAGMAGAIAPAAAQGLRVAPVSLELTPGQMVTTVVVSNDSDQPTGMQVRGFDWRQQDGQEILTPTDTLEVSPPIFEVPPGGSQLVRLVLRKPPVNAEAAYRLLFDQLPTANSRGVMLALRFSIPLFAEAGAASSSDLSLHVESGGGTASLVVRNRGTRHDRLLAPALSVGAARLGLERNTNFYILAGSEQRWPLTGRTGAVRPGGQVQLSATSLTGRLDAAVPVLAR